MTETIELYTGASMPRLGLGTYKMTAPGEASKAVKDAVSLGYRLIDTASAYKNEEEVGAGIRSCGVSRDRLFITTKVWNTAQRMGTVAEAFDRSLERLGLSYVDLYLIHWPVPNCYLETWHVMEEIAKSGRARAIGVSNFGDIELHNLLDHADILPAVNQIEYHPLLNQESIRSYCLNKGIAVQAYAPLARGAYLDRDIIQNLAEKYNRSSAQIGLRWMLQKDISVIPKTSRMERMLENSQIFDFELNDLDMASIDSMNENFRTASVPEDILMSM